MATSSPPVNSVKALILDETGHGWPAIEANNAPLHDAEHRSAKREQGARVRAHGCASSRWREIGEHRREFRQHDIAETVMPGAMVLATFAEAKSLARR